MYISIYNYIQPSSTHLDIHSYSIAYISFSCRLLHRYRNHVYATSYSDRVRLSLLTFSMHVEKILIKNNLPLAARPSSKFQIIIFLLSVHFRVRYEMLCYQQQFGAKFKPISISLSLTVSDFTYTLLTWFAVVLSILAWSTH